MDIRALKAALAKATPGPWKWRQAKSPLAGREMGGIHFPNNTVRQGFPDLLLGGPEETIVLDLYYDRYIAPSFEKDAELIVLLRNNAEALIEIAEALRAIRDLPERPAKPYSQGEFTDRAYNEAIWDMQEIADRALARLDVL